VTVPVVGRGRLLRRTGVLASGGATLESPLFTRAKHPSPGFVRTLLFLHVLLALTMLVMWVKGCGVG